MSLVIWQLARQLIHSFSGDNKLVPFDLRWKKTVVKGENIYKYIVQNSSIGGWIVRPPVSAQGEEPDEILGPNSDLITEWNSKSD